MTKFLRKQIINVSVTCSFIFFYNLATFLIVSSCCGGGSPPLVNSRET